MNDKEFGEKLRSSRKKAQFTQRELGERVGVGQVVIANYERGARFPGEEILRKLAISLNVSLDHLLSVSKTETPVVHSEYSQSHFLSLLKEKPVSHCHDYLMNWKKSKTLTTEDIYSHVLIPILRETGRLWFSGQLSIIDEHLISGKIRELITLSASEDERWDNYEKGKALWMGLCAPGEKHDLGLLMTARLLQLRGWDIRFIGVDMPVGELVKSVNALKPEVLCFAVTRESYREGLETYIKVLRDSVHHQLAIVLGGPAATAMGQSQLTGNCLSADSIIDGVESAEKYLRSKRGDL